TRLWESLAAAWFFHGLTRCCALPAASCLITYQRHQNYLTKFARLWKAMTIRWSPICTSGRSASGNMRRWFRSSRTSQRAAIPIARCYAGTRSWSTSRSRHTFAAKTTHRSQAPRSLLRYSAMPRCCRFFVSPTREERAYPKRSLTDEQRRRDEKAAQPEGKTALGYLAALLAAHRSLQACSSLASCHPAQTALARHR